MRIDHEMSKRSREEAADAGEQQATDRLAKKAKKEKKRKALANGSVDEAKAPKNILLEDVVAQDGETTGNSSGTELSREERKALKRAKKEQANSATAKVAAENVVNGTGDEDLIAKAERKAAKRAEKAARKVTTVKSPETDDKVPQRDTNGHAQVDTDPASEASAAYIQHTELAGEPQSAIDTFNVEKQITIDDPLKQNHRPIISFKHLPVMDEAQRAPFASFSEPTPIQAATWPYLFAGRDVIGVAETGSGKTLAFGVPCIRRISNLSMKERRGIQACMVSPTRELASQIHEQLVKLAEPAGLRVTCVYGGVSKDEQREKLRGTHIVVATPGRLNDFIQEGSIDLSRANYLVLDEADRMLDKGFEEDVRKIISTTPSQGRQTLMFTATWPESVRKLAETFMYKPVRINIGDNPTGELRANTRIVQEVEVIEQMEKQNRLIQLLKQYQSGKNKNDRILVFCLYKKEATRIEEFIRRRGFSVGGIHGDLGQHKRTESLEAFKQGKVPLLVATDVAARGLDIPAVKLVINLTFPLTVEDYVHRIGR